MWGNNEWTSESSCSSMEMDQEELTTLHYQSGRVEVGDKEEDGEESMRFHVDFNQPFNNVPVIFVCPEGEVGEDHPDVFGVTVIKDSVTEEGFDVNVGRMAKMHNHGWGQNLQLNWLAVDSNSAMLQAMVVEVGAKDDDDVESVNVDVKFPKPFPRGVKPAVFCTAYGEDYGDTFACCVQRTSCKKAHINVCRGICVGWGQNLEVAVLATTLFPCMTCELGPNEEEDFRDVGFKDIDYPIDGGFKRRPLIFTAPLHAKKSDYPDAFVASPANVTHSCFNINVQRGNRDCNTWGQDLRCSAILIP